LQVARLAPLKEGVEKGWVTTTAPIQVHGHLFVPWKVADDSLYTSADALWFLDNQPRSLISVHESDSLELVGLFYGLNKFGSVDEAGMGSNIRIKELIGTSVPVKISVSQKHNGEAATICGILLDDQFYYVIMSKSVPTVVQTREELNSLDSLRYTTCKEIGNQFFDLLVQMSESDILELKGLMLEYIFPIEKIDREFKHIACENPGLYILGVRESSTLNLLLNPDSILTKMEKYGFSRATEFSDEEISHRIETVREKLDLLPTTLDKPSLEEFETWSEPKNFLRVWSYVSLVYEQIVCPEITSQEILSIASGIQLEKFTLIEGTIISVKNLITGEVYMIKDKDLLYYLLRGVRTVVESYKTKPYSGKPIISRSLEHWVNYLTPVWRNAWTEFVSIIAKYMSTPNCVQAIRENYAKSTSGRIDAPDFFSSVSNWVVCEKSGSNFVPILIVTTESEAGKVRPLITSSAYEFTKPPKLEHLPFGQIGMIYSTKLGMLEKLESNISILRFTELNLAQVEQDKKAKAFFTDLISDKHEHIPLCVSFGDLELAICDLKSAVSEENESQTSNRTFGSVFKVEYFDNEFHPSSTTTTGYVKLMNMMTKINFNGKFENTPSPEQIEVAECTELIDSQIVPRNQNTGNLIVRNIFQVYQGPTNPNSKLAVFITGIPGLGKDWIADYLKTNLLCLIPELEDKILVINQDMFGCDAERYAQGLANCVKTMSLVIITRNGPGSHKSIDICKKAGFAIHLIAPRDTQVLLLAGCIQYSLQRSHLDISKSHVLSSLPDEKNVSIAANFFGVLGISNTSIASATVSNPSTFNQSEYLAIELDERHLTFEHGLVTNEHLIGREIEVKSVKTIQVTQDDYLLEFELCEVPSDISGLIDSHIPHITCKTLGFAKPIHSGWWGWIVQNFYLDSIGTVSFGSWEIKIEPCEKSQIGTMKLY